MNKRLLFARNIAVQNDEHDQYGGKPTHEAINAAYTASGSVNPSQCSVFVKADTTVATEVENLVQECVAAFGRLDMYAFLLDSFSLCAFRLH